MVIDKEYTYAQGDLTGVGSPSQDDGSTTGGVVVAGSRKKKRSPKKKRVASKGKKSGISHQDTMENRVQVQFRIGEALVAKMDAAADEDSVTRNDWLIEATLDKLNGRTNGVSRNFSQSEVTANRIPILFRVGEKVRDVIDKEVDSGAISSRTMWMIEAILARLEGYDFQGL
jgi:hypothetical protein